MKIVRNGKEFELTAEEIMLAYREQKSEYTKQDIINTIEGDDDFISMCEDLSEEEYNVLLEDATEEYLRRHDCNLADNDQRWYIVKNLLK